MSHAIASNPYFPKPAELRLSIVDELKDHRRRIDQERFAALPKPPETPRPSKEDIAHVESLLSSVLKTVADKSAILRRGNYEGATMNFLDETDPRRVAWMKAESPLEQTMACGLFSILGCRAVVGEYEQSRRAELAALVGDKPAAFVFPQHEVGRYRVDFLVVMVDPVKRASQHFIIECDGHDYHSSDEQIARDAERDEAMVAAGYKFVHRVSGSALHYDVMLELEMIGDHLRAFGVEPKKDEGFSWLFEKFSKSNKRDREEREELRQRILREEAEEERVSAVIALGETP